jgi:hypothetical protein
VFWGYAASGGNSNWVKFLVSDLNTAFMVLFYFGLTRGNSLKLVTYFVNGLGLVGILAVGGLSLSFFPQLPGGLAQSLYGHWSLCLSMVAPVLVGWGFRLRYGTSQVLIVGFIYALAQPVAYQAMVPGLEQPMPQALGEAALTLLALLKVVFGFVVVYQGGFLPANCAPLVEDIAPQRDLKVDSFLRKLAWGLLLAGCLAVITAGAFIERQTFRGMQLASLVVWVSLIAGLLNIIGFLLRRLGASRGEVH